MEQSVEGRYFICHSVAFTHTHYHSNHASPWLSLWGICHGSALSMGADL